MRPSKVIELVFFLVSTANKNLRKIVESAAGMQNSLSATLVIIVAVCFCNTSKPSKPPNYPTGQLELGYYKRGPWVDVCKVIGENCGNAKYRCDLYYPTNLGANGFHHPVLTWGNGTLAKPQDYECFLEHMASWGFVVIATEDPLTGEGKTMLNAATFLINSNSDSNSRFYQKINTDEVGSFGHSQGASGAINAMMLSTHMMLSTQVKTAVAIELPRRWACWGLNNFCTDTSRLTSGSIFLIDGSADRTSPPLQPWGLPASLVGPQSIEAYYEEAPNTVENVKATLIGPDHNDVQGQPYCSGNTGPCVNGVFGYLGYPTAWMMYHLQGDIKAKAAFVRRTEHGSGGEIFSQPKNWST
ncbi:MAG: hypothetical protein JO121_12315 [Deltaproteobacteria bacterium]|nr:hypothetical protein [Deltaproteobacteria bacterium]